MKLNQKLSRERIRVTAIMLAISPVLLGAGLMWKYGTEPFLVSVGVFFWAIGLIKLNDLLKV